MKKTMALVLSLVMLLGCFAALAEYTGAAPVFEEKVTISILSTNGATNENNVLDMAWWQKVVEKANVNLELEIIDSSTYNDVVQPRLAAGQDLPDIIKVSGNRATAIESGLFISLTELIDQYGYNLANHFEKYPNLKGALTYTDGNIYFIPYLYTTDSNYRTILLNDGYLAQLGMTKDDINTVEDLYDYLIQVRDNDLNGNGDPSDEYPLFCRRMDMMNCIAMYWGIDIPNNGGYSVAEDGTVYCDYITEEYKEFLEFANKIYSENLVNKDFISANWDMQAAAYTDNAIGATMDFISNAVDGSQLSTPGWDFFNDAPVYQIHCIEDVEGNPVVYGRSVMGSYFGISKFCDDPEAAFKFFDYLYSEEVGLQTWYGTEGYDYEVVDGEYVFSQEYLNNADAYRENSGYNMDAFPGYQYDYSSAMSPMLGAQTRQYSEYTWNPSRLDKYYTAEQQAILDTYKTDLGTYFSENATAFILGTRSLDEWDEYVQGAIDMGVEQVVAVYQEAQ